GQNNEKFQRRLSKVRFVHGDFGNEVVFPLCRFNPTVHGASLLHGKKKLASDLRQDRRRDLEAFFHPVDPDLTEKLAVAAHEGIQRCLVSFSANEIRHVDRVEVAGGEKAFYGLEIDMVSVAI